MATRRITSWALPFPATEILVFPLFFSLGPLASAVDYGKNLDCIAADAIGGDVGQARHDQLARAFNATDSTDAGVIAQLGDLSADGLNNLTGGARRPARCTWRSRSNEPMLDESNAASSLL